MNVQMRAIKTIQRSEAGPHGRRERKLISPGTIFFVDEAEAEMLVKLGGAVVDVAAPTDGVMPEKPKRSAKKDEKPKRSAKKGDDKPGDVSDDKPAKGDGKSDLI